MLKAVGFALALAVVGMILIPLIAFFGSLALFYILDPRCGTPSDSGGCEMSASVIGFAAVIPGLLIGIVAGVYFGRGRRPSLSTHKPVFIQQGTAAPATEDEARSGSGGLPEDVIDGVRRWAAGTSEVQRVWLVGARTQEGYRFDSPVVLAIETYGWDSPDPRDRLQAYSNWFHNRVGWRAVLASVIPHSIKVSALSIDGEDGALRGLPNEAQLIYEREG